LLLTISNSLSYDLYYGMINPRAPALRRVMLSKFLVLVAALLAAFMASMRFADILQFVTAAFSLAAAAFFPALVLGIFWRGATRIGATAGMLSGLAVCGWYMVFNLPLLRRFFEVQTPLADCSWWGIDAVAAGVFGVPAGALVLILVSLVTPSPGPRQIAALDLIRDAAADERQREVR
jgi:cation/acetate symporter